MDNIRKTLAIIEINVDIEDIEASITNGVTSYINGTFSKLKDKAIVGNSKDIIKFNAAIRNRKLIISALNSDFNDIYSNMVKA